MNKIKTLCLLVVGVILLTGCKMARTSIVPNVMNTTIDVARSIAEKHGFLFIISEELESDDVEKGLICKQIPLPGSVLNKGAALTVAVSKGSSKVVVPDMKGFSLPDAEVELFRLRLKLGDIDSLYSDDVDAGRVVVSHPLANSKVEKGTVIDVILSIGPEQKSQLELESKPEVKSEAESTPESEFENTVPKLTGISLAKAQLAIKDAGLTVGKISYRITGEYYAGTVMGQNPKVGEKVKKGSSIDLTVASELRRKVPRHFKWW